MTLRFIYGRTGTGKTRRCLDEVAAELARRPAGPPLVVLVPEQATFQTEQALLASEPLRGFARAQVLSFRRLAWRVLQEIGGAARPVLGDLGKRMVLAALLDRHRDELFVFGRLADRVGLPPRLAGSIRELRAQGVTAAALRERAAALEVERGGPSTLSLKARDLALLTEALEDHCADRFTDPDVQLGLLVAGLGRSAQLRGASVWIDGFAGFTPEELEVVGELLAVADRVSVTLLLDSRREPDPTTLSDSTYLFHPSLETSVALQALAKRRGVVLEAPVLLDRAGRPPFRFDAAPDLAHLEASFFETTPVAAFGGDVRRITVAPLKRRRDEVEAAAREILRLAREEGIRYRHMAVVLRDLDAYADLVEAIFPEHGVPVFVDRRRPIPHHPLVELVRAALEVLTHDWRHEAVFRYLRTDLVAVERDVVDRLESYALAHGIRAEAWYGDAPWRFVRQLSLEEDRPLDRATQAELARLDRDRRRAVEALATMRARLAAVARLDTRVLAEAVWGLLESLDVATTLGRWAQEAVAAGQPEQAREHQQAWRGVVALLDELVDALGDQPQTLDGFLAILEAGLESLDLGMIPPGLDQVVVGTIERSRHLGTRAAFVLGAIDGAYPPVPSEDPIFTDADRELLAARGLALGATARERLLHDSYFAYLTLTRASDWLWVSHPLADDDGRAFEPAADVRRLLAAFPAARRAPEPSSAVPMRDPSRPRELAASVARSLRAARDAGVAPDARTRRLARWLAADPGWRAEAQAPFAALDHEGELVRRMAPLGDELALALFADRERLRSSVSRLESFTACPFQHFANHGLALAERPSAALLPSDLGALNHAVLSRLVRSFAAEGRTWADVSDADARGRVARLVAELAPRLRNELVLDDPQHRYLVGAVERVLEGSVGLLGEHARRGRFAPLAVELPFGTGGGGEPGWVLPGLEVPVPAGTLPTVLRGRIDRVDVYVDEGGTAWARVIDYKRRPRALEDSRVFHGLDLQLLAYLLVVTAHGTRLGRGPLVPAGALYFPVHDPLPLHEARPPREVAARKWRRESRMRGVVVDDPAVLVAMGAEPEGVSDLLPVEIKKDGSTSKRGSVASPADLARLLAHVERRASEASVRILKGEIAARPYKLGRDRTPCGYCSMKPVCQFDPAVSGQGYVELTPLARGELLERLVEHAP